MKADQEILDEAVDAAEDEMRGTDEPAEDPQSVHQSLLILAHQSSS